MNKMVIVWLLLAGFLTLRSLERPSYAVGLYMMTFFAHPLFWWWGDILDGYRWNFYAGLLLLGTLVTTNSRTPLTGQSPLSTKAVRILLFLAINAVVVHVLFAANADSSLGWLTNKLKFILLFFLMQYAIKDEKDYRIVVLSIALGMGYIGYEATINERGSFSGGRIEGIGAAGVTSSNQLASLLITGLPLATTLLMTAAAPWVKVVTVACSALAFNVVLMCNSRGAFLGLILGGVVFLIMSSGPARKYAKRLLALVMLGTFLMLGDPEILNRFMTTFSGEAQRDNSAQNRIIFWTAASRMLLDYPMGSGGNSFSEGRGWRYMPRVRSEASDTRAIHNGFLTEATDWGIQGFILMLAFLWAIWSTTWQGRKAALSAGDGKTMMIFGCMAAALIAWMVSSVFGDYLDQEWGYWVGALTFAYFRLYAVAIVPATVPAEATVNVPPRPRYSPAFPRGSSL